MEFFLGFDCGATQTRALVVEATGRRGGLGLSGPGNPQHATVAEMRARLDEALSGALAAAGATRAQCVAAFIGSAGVTSEPQRAEIRGHLAACDLAHARIAVDHDIRIALAGGLGGEPGIALIVGTGSSCYGRTHEGRIWQTAGWGALVANEGSGYFLGREAIVAATRMADGRDPETPLRAAVFAWLGLADLGGLMDRLHQPEITVTEVASFAPRVVELAARGDRAAESILDRGAVLLGEMVAANHRSLPTGPRPDVTIAGGLGTADTIYRDKIHRAIRARLPTVRLDPPVLSPVAGAAMLAMQEAGRTVTPEILQNLKAFSS